MELRVGARVSWFWRSVRPWLWFGGIRRRGAAFGGSVGSVLLKSWVAVAFTLSVYLSLADATRKPAPHSMCEREAPRAREESTTPPVVPAGVVTTPDVRDRVLERLAAGEHSEELCSLLEQLEGGADPKVTYAIRDVLDRAHLRSVRVCAVQALVRQQSAEATSFLVDLAEDAPSDVGLEVLDGLTSREGELARVTLIEAAHSETPEVRFNAVLTLLRAKRPEAFALAEELLQKLEDFSTLGELARALGESGDPRAFGALSKLLEQGDRQLHLSAIDGLGALGAKEAVPLLAQLITQGSAEEFHSAVSALGRIDEEIGVARLVDLSSSENAERRRLAVGALAGFGEVARARSTLLELATSKESALAAEALQALGALHDASAESMMIDAAEHGPFVLRQAAIQGLGQLSTPSAVEALRRVLKTNPPEDRGMVFAALVSVPSRLVDAQGERIDALTSRDPTYSTNALSGLALDPSPRAQSALLAYFDDPDPARLQMLGNFAASFPPQTLTALLERHQHDADPAARRSLIASAADRADPALNGLLQGALTDADPEIRRAATRGLSLSGQPNADAMLDRLLQSDDADDRNAGLDALSRRGDDASLERLQALTVKFGRESDDNDGATLGLEALKGVSPERAAKALDTLLADAKPERVPSLLSAAQGLGKLSVSACLKGLASTDPMAQDEAVNRASELDDPRVAEALARIARDDNLENPLRERAAAALDAMGGEQARANKGVIRTLSREAGGSFSCRWEGS